MSLGVYGGVQDERSFQDSLRWGGGGCPGPIFGGVQASFWIMFDDFSNPFGDGLGSILDHF